MKFLCLAYGGEGDWKAMSKQEQTDVLAQDEVLKKRGEYLAAVQTKVVTVTNWSGDLKIDAESFAKPALPLAGFSIIEANSLDEVVQLVANTPCARAKGAIEIRPFWDFDDKSSEKKP